MSLHLAVIRINETTHERTIVLESQLPVVDEMLTELDKAPLPRLPRLRRSKRRKAIAAALQVAVDAIKERTITL